MPKNDTVVKNFTEHEDYKMLINYMEIDSIPIKKQVNVIFLSKIIKNPRKLMEKTGIDISHIEYILKHQKYILQQWRESKNNTNISSLHSDCMDGIDTLMLDWILRYRINKIKLPLSAIHQQVVRLRKLLEMPTYYIRPKIWARINSSRLIGQVSKKALILDPYAILKKEGRNLLKPEIYQKFLVTIEKNLSAHVKSDNSRNTESNDASNDSNEDVILIETPIPSIDISNDDTEDNDVVKIKSEPMIQLDTQEKEITAAKTLATSSPTDFPALLSLQLQFKTENTEKPKIKEEPQDFINDDEANPATVQIKKEIGDEYEEYDQKEYLNIGLEESLNDSTVSLLSTVIKDELELWNDNQSVTYEIYHREDSDEEDENKDDENAKHKDLDENTGDLENATNNEVEIKENSNEIELNDNSWPKIIIDKDCDNILDTPEYADAEDSKSEDDLQVVYVVEGADEDEQSELPDTRVDEEEREEEEVGEYEVQDDIEIKEEPLEDDDEEEVITLLEIVSESESESACNVEQDSDFDLQDIEDLLKKSKRQAQNKNKFLKTYINNLKRTRTEAETETEEDNIPSTSHTSTAAATSASLFTLKRRNKVPRFNFEQSEDPIYSSVKSAKEAIQCLQYIKQYFHSQHDEDAVQLLIKLQMSIFKQN